jgi:simple sugar transport system substrate-binding protein
MTFKALFATTALAPSTLSLPAIAAELTVGFSQIGSPASVRTSMRSAAAA